MHITVKKMNEYAQDRGYKNWNEFREYAEPQAAQDALEQIEMEDHA